VVEAMLPYLTTEFGNPSSSHCYGRAAARAVDTARAQVASLVGARSPKEIVFTSSGTESNHLALTGAAEALRATGRGAHVITTTIEHPRPRPPAIDWPASGSASPACRSAATADLTRPQLEQALRPDTVLVSVMHANNEIGTLQPLAEVAALTRRRHVLSTPMPPQSLASVPVDVERLGVDLLTVVGHKMYAPKGVAALYIRRGTPPLVPQLRGGGQERGCERPPRNVAGIVALGAAAAIAHPNGSPMRARALKQRERLRRELVDALPGLQVNGSLTYRLPGNLSLTIPHVTAEQMMAATPISRTPPAPPATPVAQRRRRC
jgi:cysteine desulfurase